MSIRLYGIPNCDTVKKARAWLDGLGLSYHFHDYKKAGVDEDTLRGWVASEGWETVLNRQGTTFRKLPDDQRHVTGADQALAVMLANPSAIKRPIVEYGNDADCGVLVGFDPVRWSTALEGELT